MDDYKKIKLLVDIYEDILNHLNEGIIVSDNENCLLFANKAMERIDNVSQKKYYGKKMDEIYMISPNCLNKNLHSVVLETGITPNEYYSKYIVKENDKVINALEKIYPFKKNGTTQAVYSIIKNLPVLNELLKENNYLKHQLGIKKMSNGTQYKLEQIIGKNILIIEAIAIAKRIAQNDRTVLIYGETGTGKELFAQGIHNDSSYQDGPFISINCAAIPTNLLENIFFGSVPGAFTGAGNSKGLFEQAQNGTLFLDEVNSMDVGLQAKLLKAIEEKTVRRLGSNKDISINCRIICALNQHPLECIEKGLLRRDLYYRLSNTILTIPPLNQRIDDIPILCEYFILKFNHIYNLNISNINYKLMNIFKNYHWPGNVRELEHMIESVYTINDNTINELSLDILPPYYKKLLTDSENKQIHNEIINFSNQTLKEQLDFYEKNIISNELLRQNYNITNAARVLGISRQALQYKISKYDLKK